MIVNYALTAGSIVAGYFLARLADELVGLDAAAEQLADWLRSVLPWLPDAREVTVSI